jgi:hypothetical protein
MLNEIKRQAKINNPRNSLPSLFMVLGATKEEVYATKGSCEIWKKSPLKDMNNSEILSWAKHLHKEAFKKFHPDLHKDEYDYYNEKLTVINSAFEKIKKNLKYRTNPNIYRSW